MAAAELVIHQPTKGYRFSQDALVLAAHIEPKPSDRILELGTGCGVVSLYTSCRYPKIPITAVELNPELAEYAQLNVVENGLDHRISILQTDLRTLKPERCGGRFDLIVSNPPYRRKFAGRINPNPQKAMARHEIAVTLSELLKTVDEMLHSGGQLVMIYASQRLAELLVALGKHNLSPKWLRFIHPYSGAEAQRVLVAAKKEARPGLRVRPPLIIHFAPGIYTSQASAILTSSANGNDFCLPISGH